MQESGYSHDDDLLPARDLKIEAEFTFYINVN